MRVIDQVGQCSGIFRRSPPLILPYDFCVYRAPMHFDPSERIRSYRFRRTVDRQELDLPFCRHRQVVGYRIVKDAMNRSTVVGRRDHAAMATPVTSPQVANAWRRGNCSRGWSA
jgi:hypothetical protein